MTAPAGGSETDRPALPECPYKGLVPFDEADFAFFFGRENERELIAANLLAARLTVLYGPSGVGKSSALLAGAAHDLREESRSNMRERGAPEHAVVVFRSWRDDPVAGLVAAARGAVAGLVGEPSIPQDASLTDAFDACCQKLDGQLLVILDQFEEYFLYHGAERGAGTFDDEFPRVVNRLDLRVSFLVSIREDAHAKLDAFKGRIPVFENYLRIDHLGVAAARAACTRPIDEYNRLSGNGRMSIEPKLVDEIVGQVEAGRVGAAQKGAGVVDGDVAAGRVEAPFLQLVLRRLWDEERRSGSTALRTETLHRLGGAEQIVKARLDEALASLPPDEQEVAARIFQFLVTPSGTKIAHSAADLASFTDLDLDVVERVLEKLAAGDARILRPIAPPAGEETGSRYEVFHDVLAGAVLDWRTRWREAANRREAYERARKSRRRVLLFLGLSALLIVTTVSIVLTTLALKARTQANRAREAARSAALAAESASALGADPARAISLAERALLVRRTPAAESALRTAISSTPLRFVIRHDGGVHQGSYSRDGRRILTVGADRRARVTDAATGRIVATIGYGRKLTSAVLSPDGRLVATASRDDNTVRIWRADTGAAVGGPLRSPKPEGAWFDPSGRRVVSVSWDGVVRLWRIGARSALVFRTATGSSFDTAAFDPRGQRILAAGGWRVAWTLDARTGRELRPLLNPKTVDTAAWSPNGSRVVTGGGDDRAYLWNASTGERIGPPLQETGDIAAAVFSPDGNLVATVAAKHARVWNAHTGRLIADLEGHRNWVNNAAFRRDGRLLVTASDDGTARVWDIASQTTLLTLLGHSGPVKSAAFSPDGRSVLTAGADGTARVWDASTGRELWGHTGWVLDAAFSPDGQRLITAGQDHRLILWNPRTGRKLRSVRPATEALNSVEYSPRGDLVVTASDDGTAVVRTASTLHFAWSFQLFGEQLTQAAFSPDAKHIAASAGDGWAGIFNTRTRALERYLHENRKNPEGPAHDDSTAVTGIAWSRHRGFIATTGQDGRARIWDARSGALRRTFALPGVGLSSPAFTRDGDFLVAAGADGTARVWNLRAMEPAAVLSQPEPINAAAFSPDGRLVATGSTSGTTRVWDWRRGVLLSTMHRHADFINAVGFSPDGRQIVSASDDETAKIYRCTTCGRLSGLLTLARRRERLALGGS